MSKDESKWPVQDMSGIQEEESEADLVPVAGDEMKSLVVAEEMRSKTPVEEAPFEQATKPVTKAPCSHMWDSLVSFETFLV